jgi:hypothetical protein
MTAKQQVLVRFGNRTLVVPLYSSAPRPPGDDDGGDDRSSRSASQDDGGAIRFIQQEISWLTGWSPERLEVARYDPPFCSVRVVGCLRGGKGGFGTLLKGQSRQAAARATVSFGACRDLQGRRLRHVNDAVSYQVWREWRDKVDAGTASVEDMAQALIDTDSGIAGWRLQLPAWAEVSGKKEHRKMRRLLVKWKRDREQEKAAKEKQREMEERRVASYVEKTDAVQEKVQASLSAALERGLRRQKEQEVAKRAKVEPEPPAALLTLSGDVVLAYEKEKWQMQSKSNFCTVAIVLDREKVKALGGEGVVLYWEMALVSAGIVQMGWASAGFRPDSEEGDGVGDDKRSWGYDGSRQIKLHAQSTESYGDTAWKAEDVVGCKYELETGKISYSIHGQDLGVAFEITAEDTTSLFPVVSCNPGEIVELRLSTAEMQYSPEGSTAVGAVLATEDVTLDSVLEGYDEDEEETEEEEEKPPSKAEAAFDQELTDETPPVKPAPVKVEPLDLDNFGSAEELEKLGLDRLKGALMAAGVKCGGTLQERANRLFSLKGLEPEDYPKKLLAKKKKK